MAIAHSLILQAALASRARYQAAGMSEHGLAVARGHYVERLGQLLQSLPSRRVAVRRFQQHLMSNFDAIFSFLFDPTLNATNWRGARARPAVVTRKMCGGAIARPQGRQSTSPRHVLRTADQRGLDATDVLVALITAPYPGCHRVSRLSRHYNDPLNKDPLERVHAPAGVLADAWRATVRSACADPASGPFCLRARNIKTSGSRGI
jgi:hypothetical protein